MIECITPYCKESHIVSRVGQASRTPGFNPDYECLSCGARWLDTAAAFFGPRRSLRDMSDAMREYRAGSGSVEATAVLNPVRAGRRAP